MSAPRAGRPDEGELDLVAFVCCDLGAIVRGRALPADELDAHLATGVGWVPANHALTPLGPLAEPNPFDSTGDLRLLPDVATRAQVAAGSGGVGGGGRLDDDPESLASRARPRERGALDIVLCDIVQTDGSPWECCPRSFLRVALDELADTHGLRLLASFEHEFQLLPDPAGPRPDPAADPSVALGATPVGSSALPFSLDALRRVEPFPRAVMSALRAAGAEPERVFAEYAPHQFEIPVRPAEGLAAADRSVVLTEVVRDVARRCGARATFTPLLDPGHAGNGVHVHLSLLDAAGEPVIHDAARPGCLSELGARFAAGVLLHARALTALTAPNPLSSARLKPHRWSAGAICLGLRNRETLLRLPPLVGLGGQDPARQLRLEYRAADASANPYLALGAIVRAGMHGIEAGLPAPPILDRDPATLGPDEAARYGVGALPTSLPEALEALAEDDVARGWLSPLTYDAYLAVRSADLLTSTGWDVERMCRRYAHVY